MVNRKNRSTTGNPQGKIPENSPIAYLIIVCCASYLKIREDLDTEAIKGYSFLSLAIAFWVTLSSRVSAFPRGLSGRDDAYETLEGCNAL
jgi:hypothetical protein